MQEILENLNLDNNKNLINNFQEDIGNLQKNFLNSNFKNIINSAVDIGLRMVLPDLVENQIIDAKNTILDEGWKEGLNSIIESGLDLGKSAIGILTGNFENVSQIQNAVKNGGLIDGVSGLLDVAVKTAQAKGIIDKSVGIEIKKWKNNILNTISNDIENNLQDQLKQVEKIGGYCEKWNNFYQARDFDNMEKMYNNIEKAREKIVPLENIIKQVNKIENLHNLIKNNGNNFDVSENVNTLAEYL